MFGWIPLNNQIVERVLASSQQELLALIDEMKDAGLKVIDFPTDLSEFGDDGKLSEMDPFTFLANIYRGITYQNRVAILEYLRELWGLSGEVQSEDENYIPEVYNGNVGFFPWRKDRKPDDVSSLWELAKQAHKGEIVPELFDRCMQIRQVGFAKLTMGLFWINPNIYLPMDGRSVKILKGDGFTVQKDGETYLKLCGEAKERYGNKPIYELSLEFYLKEEEPKPKNEVNDRDDFGEGKPNYWCISPGANAVYWDHCLEYGYIGLEWNDVGDLLAYGSRKEIQAMLNEDTGGIDGSNQIYTISREDQEGKDFAQGWYSGEGIGFVLKEGSTIRKKSVGDKEYREKTLLQTMLTEGVLEEFDSLRFSLKRDYKCNSISSAGGVVLAIDRQRKKQWEPLHDRITSTDSGTSSRMNDTAALWEFSREIKVGDYVFAKKGTKEVLGVGVVKSGYRYDPNQPHFWHVIDVDWQNIGPWQMENRLPIKTVTQYTQNDPVVKEVLEYITVPQSYSDEEALKDLLMSRETFFELKGLLKGKQNLIIQGPPGVGKSFVARRLAFALMGEKAKARIGAIQFHQSYAYEDFIQGYRPTDGDGASFERKDGVFYEFCKKAQRDPDRDYVFIIDEINRGNLSRILGECMLLIENDKRSADYAVKLTYAKAYDEDFFVPPNVFILGLMNTADRSLAMVDYALRRRFAFYALGPEFESDDFRELLSSKGASATLINNVRSRLGDLNKTITEDKELGSGFVVGHSYFCPGDDDNLRGDRGKEWFETVVRNEIAFLLQEYWPDVSNEKAQEHVDALLKDYG